MDYRRPTITSEKSDLKNAEYQAYRIRPELLEGNQLRIEMPDHLLEVKAIWCEQRHSSVLTVGDRYFHEALSSEARLPEILADCYEERLPSDPYWDEEEECYKC